MATGIAFVGCGYVADLYMPTLQNWADRIALRGVYDIRPERLAAFTGHHGVRGYASFEELLADDDVEIVLNLTNPFAHYQVSRAALEAGKHVYSEKPLSIDFSEARALVELARERGLTLCSAPATVLGPAAQALWRAVRSDAAGAPRLIYVELDDGPVHQLGYENWISPSGAPWPARDEFLTGCTVEHAGYALTWLAAMFGPVRRVVSAAALQIPDKGPDTPEPYASADFLCAVLEFDGGLKSRMTNSIVATNDHRLRIFCDDRLLSVAEI